MGQDLIVQLALATNLPYDYAFKKINELIIEKGMNIDSLTEEDIRVCAAHLLHDVILGSLETQNTQYYF